MKDKIKYFFPKLRNRISTEKSRLYEKVSVERFSLSGIDDIKGKDDFINKLHHLLGEHISIKEDDNWQVNQIIEAADKGYRHIFNLFGSGDISLPIINWNVDLKTNFEWPKGVFYTKQRTLTPIGSDIKFPWELSRCHHLLWLGEAYQITKEEKYAQEVVDEMIHWIDQNPLMYTVNWTCAMDVAIRAINWMYALLFIEKSSYFYDEFARKVYKSLYQHAFFISNNLERSIPYSNNHYVSNIVGLLFLGAFFSTTKKGRKFFKLAKKEYIKEILIEVLPSGVNYEKSVSYHRLMTELLVYSRSMLERIGEILPKEVNERLTKMLEYVGHYSYNGSSPLVGDNDNGRLLPFVPRQFKDHTYLLDSNSFEYRIINNGINPLPINNSFLESKLYADANVAILKKGNGYMFVGCCERWRFDKITDKYVGTHLHNDLLSFVYVDNGREIIVDPGTYSYTSDINSRNEFRSAKKHNTVVVDDEEHNLLADYSAFGMKYNSKAKPLVLSDDNCVCCKGEYETIRGRMTHQRVFILNSEGLEINDLILKVGYGHKLYMSYHFAKDVKASLDGNKVNLSVGGKDYCMCISAPNQINLSLITDTISPSFGILEQSQTIAIQAEFTENINIKTLLKNNNG